MTSPHVWGSGFPNPEIFAHGMQNPGFWNPEYNSRSPESHCQILESSTWNPRLSWIPLHRVNDNSEAKKKLYSSYIEVKT